MDLLKWIFFLGVCLGFFGDFLDVFVWIDGFLEVFVVAVGINNPNKPSSFLMKLL